MLSTILLSIALLLVVALGGVGIYLLSRWAKDAFDKWMEIEKGDNGNIYHDSYIHELMGSFFSRLATVVLSTVILLVFLAKVVGD